MTRCLIGFLLVLCAVAQSEAQATVYKACVGKAATQAAVTACASDEARRVDAELNKVYKDVLAKTAEPAEAEKVRVAQRAWVAYRDAYIAAKYPAADKQTEYGSSYSSDVALLAAKLTRLQIDALRELLDGR